MYFISAPPLVNRTAMWKSTIPRLFLRQLGPQPFLSFSHFGRVRQGEVVRLEYLANLDFGTSAEGSSLEPLDCFLNRLCLPEPVAGNEFLAFGKWPIDHCIQAFRKSHALALGTRVESISSEHHSRFYQLFVELPHFRNQFLGGKNARLRIFTAFHKHHKSHGYASSLC